MQKTHEIPFSQMHEISSSGVFVKHFSGFGKTKMKSYAHRDDYFIIVMLTEGTPNVEIDFERIELKTGDLLIISPWQIHKKPSGEEWNADGWMLAISPEMLSESEINTIEKYSVSPRPFNPGEKIFKEIETLCSMMERNEDNKVIATSLAASVKSFVLSALRTTDNDNTRRYKSITAKLRRLLDSHLHEEKSPAAYASMLNISEVYLNEAVKGATGLNVGSYIRGIVVAQAKRQLAYTSLSTTEIAWSLGYEDYAYFSKLFKKSVGKSPSEYRKNLR